MVMKKIYNLLILFGLMAFAGGCTDDFDEINTEPIGVSSVPLSYIFFDMEGAPVANYQRNVNLFPDFYSQYWANTVNSFESGRYEYNDGWIGNQFREHYTNYVTRHYDLIRQAGGMVEEGWNKELYGVETAYTNAVAMAEIFMCYRWIVMIDTYGDLPYFDVSLGEPGKYSTQKDISDDLFSRLANAVGKLSDDSNQFSYGDYDLYFNGDVNKWKRFGNSLRLRLAMRLSNIDAATAQKQAKEAVDAGVMESNDDVARYPLDPTGWYDYLHQMAWSWDNIRISKTFTDHLYSQSSVGEDPRAALWLAYKDGKTGVPFEGVENGYDVLPEGWREKATMNFDNEGYKDFNHATLNCPVMFYSEVCFMKAEAALRGWISGSAQSIFEEGVKASMDYVGVAGDKANAYVAGLTTLSGSNEAQLKQIITQKWIANFPNGQEGWADFRRTDYPDLTLPIEGISGNATVAANKYVKRIRYPDNQHDLNEANLPDGYRSYDDDRMDKMVWWDVKGAEEKGADGLMDSNF
ncbi:SusD/RagB family nutrient-binding outer membrane lipoprotein [Marinilabiliaceae bacterium JC017]|nr:SusD/RagB family nutrient-binding outer membrane lipoprotein [Marinilabiliaceae bacterium JC017]